jgi:hypothetical protein
MPSNARRLPQPIVVNVVIDVIRRKNRCVMGQRVPISGFAARPRRKLGRERRTAAVAELIATIVLGLGTIVAATAVTVGFAHADVVDGIVGHEGSLFAVALMLGLLFIGMGGLTVLSLSERPRRPRH